jgi:hypothetical protein
LLKSKSLSSNYLTSCWFTFSFSTRKKIL